MPEQPGSIFCPSCKRRYAFKPELAGRRVKCKCGEVMTMPQTPPVHMDGEDEPLYAMAQDTEALRASAPKRAPVSSAVRCPSCSSLLPDGSVVCINCGFNLKTKHMIGTAVVAGSASESDARETGAAPLRSLSYPSLTRRDRETAQEQQGLIKFAVIAVLLVMLAGGAVVGMRFLAGPKQATTPALVDDAEVAEMISDYGATEARKWLSERSGRMISSFSPSQANHRIQGWYDMGAKKVLAFGGMASLAVAIELPEDPQQRAALIAEARRWGLPPGGKPVVDVGQKYVLYRLGM